jgi:hypothetical protein
VRITLPNSIILHHFLLHSPVIRYFFIAQRRRARPCSAHFNLGNWRHHNAVWFKAVDFRHASWPCMWRPTGRFMGGIKVCQRFRLWVYASASLCAACTDTHVGGTGSAFPVVPPEIHSQLVTLFILNNTSPRLKVCDLHSGFRPLKHGLSTV